MLDNIVIHRGHIKIDLQDEMENCHSIWGEIRRMIRQQKIKQSPTCGFAITSRLDVSHV